MARGKVRAKSAALAAGVLAVGLALGAGCQRPPEPPGTELPEPKYSDGCEICLETTVRGDPYGQPLGGAPYVPNQFLLVGLPEDIDRVAEGVRGAEAVASLQLGEAMPGLRDMREAPPGKGALLPDSLWQQLPDTEVRLFQLGGNATAEALDEAFTSILQRVDEVDLRGVLLADLNYVAGAPWTISGGTLSGEAARLAGNDAFWPQWAFSQATGIGLLDASQNRLARATGSGTTIILFDTSPFDNRGVYSFPGWADPILEVSVSLPVPVPQAASGIAVSDHGLFAAGLAHAVAPDSTLHLVRVLNDAGEGYLTSLIEASSAAIARRMADSGDNSLQNTVFNFSLTVPADRETVGTLNPRAADVIAELASRAGFPPDASGDVFPSVVLSIPFEIIARSGGVAVAAAGNDSDAAFAAGTPALPAALPAAFPSVIGVEGGTQAGTTACYSNTAIDGVDTRAPGGDGDRAANCVAKNTAPACTDNAPECEWAVISYMVDHHRGFGTWVGSSFAAPLASGAAALDLESGAPVDFGPTLVIR